MDQEQLDRRLARIARVDLSLVPSHPDGASGLAFLEGLPSAFSLVAFASSTVVASRWAHDVVYHGVHVDSLRVPAVCRVSSVAQAKTASPAAPNGAIPVAAILGAAPGFVRSAMASLLS